MSTRSAGREIAETPVSGTAPEAKGSAVASRVIFGAMLALGGTTIASARPLVGHALLVAGVALFAFGRRPADEARDGRCPRGRWGGSRIGLAGFALFAAATATRALAGSDALVLGLWLAALGLVVAGALVGRVAAPTREAVVVLLLAATAGAMTFVRLTEVPWPVHGDVGEIALGALALNVPRDLFRPTDWWSIPGMHHAIPRLALSFDDGLFGARAADAAVGVASAVVLYAVVKEISGPRAAGVATLLGVGSANMIHSWRLGVAVGPPIFLMLAALWAFLRGVRARERPRDFFLLAGLAAGLAVQVYLTARAVPLALAALAAHEVLFGSADGRRRVLRGFSWTVASAMVVAGPLLVFYALQPAASMPLSGKSVFSASGFEHSLAVHHTASLPGVLLGQCLASLGMIHVLPNGAQLGFFVRTDGFFEPLTAALVWLGAASALVDFRARRGGWPLLAFVVGLAPVALTIDPPSYHRAGPAAAMALVLAGVACARLLAACGRQASVVAAVLAVTGFLWGTSAYFSDHCRRDWQLSDSTAVARRVAVEPASSFTYLLAAPTFSFRYGNIRFLARERRGIDLAPAAPAPRGLAPGVNLFIALPRRAAELRAMARDLPPGEWEEHRRRGSDELEILVLRIVVPPRDPAGAPAGAAPAPT